MRNKKGKFIKGVYVGFGFKKGSKPWNKDKKGIHLSKASEFKKGMTPHNKGISMTEKQKEHLRKTNRGKRFSPKTEFISEQLKGEKNYKWKGDEVGYWGVHTWIQRTLGKAKECKNRTKQYFSFKCSKKSFNFDWANKSRTYKREVSDWVELCHSCHLKADKRKLDI